MSSPTWSTATTALSSTRSRTDIRSASERAAICWHSTAPLLRDKNYLGRLASVEDPVSLFGIGQPHAVADDLLRVEPPGRNQIEQRPHVPLHLALSGSEADRLVPNTQLW